MSLKEYLDNKKCFKLICGAGNQNYNQITNLCALYSKAGCRFFDINASIEAIKAAKKGISYSIAQKDIHEYSICISIGAKNDPHTIKCQINKTNCSQCSRCENICPQNAIKNTHITQDKCIGCQKCIEVCPNNTIEKYSQSIPYKNILPDLIKEGIDCIEYHATTDNEKEVESTWELLTNLYNGPLSICLDRSKIGNEQILSRLSKLKSMTKNQLFIVQADGAPMSGGNDDYKTTLQAVAMADIVANCADYIFLSGGTNTKTLKLAKLSGLTPTGVAIGSFARKAVKEYIDREDFLINQDIFNKALAIAKNLITTCLEDNL